MPYRLVSRAEWGAKKHAMEPEKLKHPLPAVFIKYYTRSEGCHTFKECKAVLHKLQHHHMHELRYIDIKYNFLIGGDGTVYEGRGWLHASTKQDPRYEFFMENSVDIALIGNFKEVDPPPVMLSAAKDIIDYGVKTGFLANDFELIENRKDTIMPYDPGFEVAYANEHRFLHVPF